MNYRRLLILALLLILGQVLITVLMGLPSEPLLSTDSNFYLDGAERFPFLLPKQRTYLGMIFYIRICSWLGSAPWAALFFNSVAVWVAAEALWQITCRSAGERAGWIAAGLWLLNPLTAQWTRYVLTEPLFFSAVIDWLWFAVFRPGSCMLLYSAVVATLRPNGFTLLAAALSWVVVLQSRKRKQAIGYLMAGWIFLGVAIVVFAHVINPEAGKVPGFIASGLVIHGHPELALSMDKPLAVPRLLITRLAVEFGQWRPWYSFRFNDFIAIFMATFYLLALRGAWHVRGTRLFWAVILVTIPSLLVIAFAWSIHEGRFAWWALVAWIPWVAIGCQHPNAVLQQNRLNVHAKS